MFGMNILMIFVVGVPLILALIFFFSFQSTRIMFVIFFYALCSTVSLFAIVSFMSYRRSLAKIKKDLKEKTKFVESSLITEKKYMPLNNTWHFYVSSVFKYSIEVSEEDFHHFEVNDEVNIEYSRYSKEYFGYF